MNTDPCGDKDCPCVELIKRLSARIEHRTECEAWQCGTCSGGSEREQIRALHVFKKAQIPVEIASDGVFLIGEGRRRFYFWPKSAKWRAKGRPKVYRSRGPEHVAEILQREQKGVVMTFDDLYREILKILPEATTGEDNEGQLIIYTDRMIDPHGDGEKLMSFEPYRTHLLESIWAENDISPEAKDQKLKTGGDPWDGGEQE